MDYRLARLECELRDTRTRLCRLEARLEAEAASASYRRYARNTNAAYAFAYLSCTGVMILFLAMGFGWI